MPPPPQELCEHIAHASGYTVNAIDEVLRRACAELILDARTASLLEPLPPSPPSPYQVELFAPEQGELFAV